MTDALQFSVVVAMKRTENRGVTVSNTSKINYEADPQVVCDQNQKYNTGPQYEKAKL